VPVQVLFELQIIFRAQSVYDILFHNTR
jgi:hypothetical protein